MYINIKILLLVLILFLSSLTLYSQRLSVSDGGIYIKGETKINIKNTNLNVSGELKASDNSTLIVDVNNSATALDGNISLQNLALKGDCILNSDLDLKGNIDFVSGNVNLNNRNIYLSGSFINEKENAKAFSDSGGEIIKIINLSSGENKNIAGLGLSLNMNTNINNIELRRSNQSVFNLNEESINRQFSFSAPLAVKEVGSKYFKSELKGKDESKLLIATSSANKWTLKDNLSKIDNEIYAVGGTAIDKLTLFSTSLNTKVITPNGFSPNGDGVGDNYVIADLADYPDNKLVIFDRYGTVLYEKAPYNNEWDGTSAIDNVPLEDGTYFFCFYFSKDNVNKARRGFIELKRK